MRTRSRAAVLVAAPVLALALTAGSCERQDPCRDVAKADPALVAAAAEHPEIEIEAEGHNEAECILTPSGRWADETDG